jgi:DNA-binding XRE family transcriptional regulator
MKSGRKNTRSTEASLFRSQTGLSQIDFAKVVGVSPATIQSLEIGRLKLSDKTRLKMIMATDPGRAMDLIEAKVNQYRQKLLSKFNALKDVV